MKSRLEFPSTYSPLQIHVHVHVRYLNFKCVNDNNDVGQSRLAFFIVVTLMQAFKCTITCTSTARCLQTLYLGETSYAITTARPSTSLSDYPPLDEPGTSTAKQLHHFPSKMASTSIGATGAPANAPGEQHEVRQTTTTEDMKPNPSQSLPLSAARQALVDDIIALYSCEPTIKRVERYTPDCVYDDQFVYANDRYKMAGQWFALPKLFKESRNEGYQVIKNEDNCELLFSWIDFFYWGERERDSNELTVIQFKNEQSWTFKIIPKTATINALVSLSLEPGSEETGFVRVKYHKDQANDKDYSHEGLGFSFKKWQADQVAKHMNAEEVKYFEKDKVAGKEAVRKYGSGDVDGNAPKKDL